MDYLSVTALTKYIKNVLEQDNNLKLVYLKGEISNFKDKNHFYFSLKDENAKISAIMFASNVKRIKFIPEDGMQVLVIGRISLYEPTGNYQIYVEDMASDGVGNLHLAFEKLKQKLNEEGLFNEKHKLSIPKMPKTIGVITADTGAAIKDIISTIKRRYPICKILLFPTLVQGENAKDNIVKQIKKANDHDLDVIILGRGGGSIEDLWPFNEEEVARAIYDSEIPIISAVGHEIDYTISDYVSDLRAPTPTGAAELVVPNMVDIINYINQVSIRLNENLYNTLGNLKTRLKNVTSSYIFANPNIMYEQKMQQLDNAVDKIKININNLYTHKNNNYINLIGKLKILNPLSALERGYTITRKNKKSISNIKKITIGDKLNVEFIDGNINVIVEEKNNG